MAQKRAFRRHQKVEPSWKKEVLQNRGKRDETPSSITGVLVKGTKATVLVAHKPTVLVGTGFKRDALR